MNNCKKELRSSQNNLVHFLAKTFFVNTVSVDVVRGQCPLVRGSLSVSKDNVHKEYLCFGQRLFRKAFRLLNLEFHIFSYFNALSNASVPSKENSPTKASTGFGHSTLANNIQWRIFGGTKFSETKSSETKSSSEVVNLL